MRSSDERIRCLILGIGNLLMGDEGVGVRVVERIADADLPEGVERLDGGTGGLHLLGPMQSAQTVVLVDATVDGQPPGTVRRLRPRFSRDYPPTLTAHDIGLKDLLDALELAGDPPQVVLYAISIDPPRGLATELTPTVEAALDRITGQVMQEAMAAADPGSGSVSAP